MNVQKVFASLLLSICCFNCLAQGGAFKIEGKFNTGTTVTSVYFTQGSFKDQAVQKPVEVAVKDGKFTISGQISEPAPATLSLSADAKADGNQTRQFILDVGKITITVKDQLQNAVVSGSKAQDDMFRYTTGQSPYVEKFGQLNAEAQEASAKGISPDSLTELFSPRFREAQKELVKFQKGFIAQNPGAYISLLIIPDLAKISQNYMEADSLFEQLNASVKTSPTAKLIKEFITAEKKVSVGAQAPPFSLADTTSKKKISLASLRGKYVLLDFWASWCGPCRQENPNVVQAYQTYKNKDFTVFGVSLDRDRKSWLNAIRDDKLTWPQVSDLKFWASEAAVLYGVQAIPRNFLIDPQGKIIARDLRGSELLDKLEELFGRN